jgi:NAD(P)H-nitrite reductase large subunit
MLGCATVSEDVLFEGITISPEDFMLSSSGIRKRHDLAKAGGLACVGQRLQKVSVTHTSCGR